MAALRILNQDSGARSPRVGWLVASHAVHKAFRARLVEYGLDGITTVVQAHGFAQVHRSIAASDVLVLPRRLGSGYPIKLLNYMSAAKPIITAGCGGKALRNGVDGLVVPDDDPRALAYALREVADNPAGARRLGEQARRNYRQALTWDAVVPAWSRFTIGFPPFGRGRLLLSAAPLRQRNAEVQCDVVRAEPATWNVDGIPVDRYPSLQ